MKIGVTQIILKGYTLDQMIDLCQTAGYDILELVFRENGELDVNLSDDELKQLKDRLQREGIEVTSVIATHNNDGNFLVPDPARQEMKKQSLIRSIEIAHAMEVGAVLLHPGQLTPRGSYSQLWDSFVGHMKDVAPIAEKLGVAVAIENVWNKFILSPLEMRLFTDEVNSDSVGCYLDTANMMAYGFPEHWIDELGDRIKRVHFKDFRRRNHSFVPLQEGDTDWPVIMDKLRAIDYNAGVIHECSGDRDHLIEMARRMRAIVGS